MAQRCGTVLYVVLRTFFLSSLVPSAASLEPDRQESSYIVLQSEIMSPQKQPDQQYHNPYFSLKSMKKVKAILLDNPRRRRELYTVREVAAEPFPAITGTQQHSSRLLRNPVLRHGQNGCQPRYNSSPPAFFRGLYTAKFTAALAP